MTKPDRTGTSLAYTSLTPEITSSSSPGDLLMRQCLAVLAALVGLCCASCGSSGLYPVRGQVLFDSKPAVGATVTFLRNGADPMREAPPQGVVGEDGTFTLAGPSGSGAVPGDYVVLVEWKEGAGTAPGRAPALNAPDRLEKRYLDSNHPLLTARVEAKSNVLPPFEVK
jgi:hypothetical protein